ncbi:unnamed protein product, partial [Amoebophrya sp. A25]
KKDASTLSSIGGRKRSSSTQTRMPPPAPGADVEAQRSLKCSSSCATRESPMA